METQRHGEECVFSVFSVVNNSAIEVRPLAGWTLAKKGRLCPFPASLFLLLPKLLLEVLQILLRQEPVQKSAGTADAEVKLWRKGEGGHFQLDRSGRFALDELAAAAIPTGFN